MSYLIDVIITWPLWGALTYECEIIPESGSRVLVPVGNKNRVGFVKGLSDKNLIDFKIKPVKNIIDSRRVIDSDLWDMALWAGKICMCGEGSALNLILPKKFLIFMKSAALTRLTQREMIFICQNWEKAAGL